MVSGEALDPGSTSMRGGAVADLHQLARIHQALARLSPAERRVAELVLERPQAVVDQSIMTLADRAAVSEPTVVRFCRKVGCQGFGEFKLQLARSLAAGISYLDMDIAPGDGAATYKQKVFDSTITTLISVRNRLDAEAIERAVDALARARRIEFYGFVASGAVATDAQHKFFHFDVPCLAYHDLHMQRMSAAALGPEDVVVAISHTGRTKELIDSVEIALESGATVIGVTDPDSPLGRKSSIVVGAAVPENTDVYMPSTSRIAHLLIIDVLAVGVALRGGERTADRLYRMKAVLQDRRLPFDGGRPGPPGGEEGMSVA
jgi:RpiR family transcriptional regulator, carbohydrate utilization regulator